MNALNHKYGIAIPFLVTLLAVAGCQPAPKEQPTATSQPTAIPQPTATSQPTATPQPTATLLPTATPTLQPTATPTFAPTEIVVAEGEEYCPVLDFEEVCGPKVKDPELGYVNRACILRSRFTCPEPYPIGKCVAISDFAGSPTAFMECVNDKGGVWKGTYEWVLKPQFVNYKSHELNHWNSVGTYIGEGQYKGLQMSYVYDIGTSTSKYRITKSVLKEQPTATPTVVPTEIVLAEGEAYCPLVDFEEEKGSKVKDPDLGDVYRAFVQKFNWTCPEPYLKGKCVEIQDFSSLEDYTYPPKGLIECITDEGGVWKGTYEWVLKPQFVQYMPLEVNYFTSLGIFKGEGQYKGLQMSNQYDLETSIVKFRVTRLAEE